MVCKYDALQCIAVLSPCQYRCHGLWFASLMLHSALLFCHPPNIASCCFPPNLADPQVVLPNPGSSSSSSAEIPTKFSMTRRFNMDQVPPIHPPNLAIMVYGFGILNQVEWLNFMIWHPKSSGEVQFHDLAAYIKWSGSILLSWFMVCKSDASQCIAVRSPSQSCSHVYGFAS